MTPEQIARTLAFMDRVQMTGQEAFAWVECVQALRATKAGVEKRLRDAEIEAGIKAAVEAPREEGNA